MNKLNDIVVVTGVSASGKDYLLNKAEQTLAQSDITLTTFSFGSEIQKRIQEAKGDIALSRDSLRTMPAAKVRLYARQVIDAIKATEGTKVLNTHVTYREEELVVVDPAADLNVAARDYVFVSSDPEEIFHRRVQDPSRQRLHETVEMVTIHQDIALAAVRSIARVQGSGLTVISNVPANTQCNVELLAGIISGRPVPE